MPEKEEKKTTKATAAKKAPVKKAAPKKEASKIAVKKSNQVVSKKKNRKEITFSIGEGKKYTYAVGKRKTAVARVRLYENGKGQIEVNGKDVKDYFTGILSQNATDALKATESSKSFDVTIKVLGGGVSAQSDAVRNGIAKALAEYDVTHRPLLKKMGYVTRDSRVKERKKPGLKRARRAPQWRKR